MKIGMDVGESTRQMLSNMMIMLTCWYFNLKYLLKGSFLKAGCLVDELLGINWVLKALIFSGDWWVMHSWYYWELVETDRCGLIGGIMSLGVCLGSIIHLVSPHPSPSPFWLPTLSPFWISWVEQPPLPHSPYTLLFCRQRTLNQHL